MLTGVIDAKTFVARINFLSDKRINRLEELMTFESSMNIPATYFFVMQPGLGVAYKAEKAKPVIGKLLENGFNTGVHGMAYNDPKAMQQEFDTFKKISGLNKFGIRMHYLRTDTDTRNKLSATGYSFDSTDYGIARPYSIGKMIEFPISIMDVYSVRPEHKTFKEAKAYTEEKMEQAANNNIPFFTINFHDMLFDPAYALYMEWFTWIIGLCKQKGYSFISFENALKQYESSSV